MTAQPRRRKTDKGVRRLLPERFPERFYRDAWSLALTVVVLLGLWFGYSGNNDRIDDIQRERVRNTVTSCESGNAKHRSGVETIDVLTKLAFLRTEHPAQRETIDQLISQLADAASPAQAKPILDRARALVKDVPDLPAQASLGKAYTLAILNPIVPEQNCAALVQRLIPSGTP